MSTSSPSPRQRRLPREETRRRVLEAAAAVFAERGYEATTLDEVAAAAGFSKGAVYSNFESKQALFLGLMRERIQARLDSVRVALAPPGTLGEQAQRAGAAIAGELARDPEWHLLFVEFWVQAVRDPGLREILAGQRRAMRGLIAELLEEQAERLGLRLPIPAADLATIALALANGLAIEHLVDPPAVDPDLYGTALNLLLHAVESEATPPTRRGGATARPASSRSGGRRRATPG